MRARLSTIAGRLAILVGVWLLGTATFSLAQESGTTATPEPAQTVESEQAGTTSDEQEPLYVPDVRALPYVFAKGVLEDAGFAWKVTGKVKGFAVNLVAEQSIKPGTRVLDTGAPMVELRLEKNPDYEERGLPDNTSLYRGTEVVLANGAALSPAEEPATTEGSTEQAETTATDETTTPGAETTEPETYPAPSDAAETTDPAADAAATEPADTSEDADPAASDASAKPTSKPEAVTRPPAFAEAGAPTEPLDEIPLPVRAQRLQARIAKAQHETRELFDFWAYQHAWIVTGAEFGWWHGAQALRILITVDEDAQQRFGWGADSEAEARAALAEVLKKSK